MRISRASSELTITTFCILTHQAETAEKKGGGGGVKKTKKAKKAPLAKARKPTAAKGQQLITVATGIQFYPPTSKYMVAISKLGQWQHRRGWFENLGEAQAQHKAWSDEIAGMDTSGMTGELCAHKLCMIWAS